MLRPRVSSWLRLRRSVILGGIRRFSGEHVEVPVGSNGSVQLTIQKSPKSSKIILFFPRGPVPGYHSRGLEKALGSAYSARTVVSVNYRCDESSRFPMAIHDAVAGYDWVMENLVNSTDAVEIAACGELIGGGLATMLALTESHKHKTGISSLALVNPILDWTFPDEAERPSDLKSLSKKLPSESSWHRQDREFAPSPVDLLRTRKAIFHNRSGCFDQFASPLLLFRTPRIEYYSISELQEMARPAEEDPPPDKMAESEIQDMQTYLPKRSYNLTFPPANSLLQLPRTLIAYHQHSPLADQANELASLMRRSIVSNEFSIRRTRGLGSSLKQIMQDSKDGASKQSTGTEISEKEAHAVAEAGSRIQTVSLLDDGIGDSIRSLQKLMGIVDG